MKDPRFFYIRFLLVAFLVTGVLVFCILPISYRRDTFPHPGGTSRIGERGDGEEIRHTDERDTEDLLLHLWRQELSRHPDARSLVGRRR